MLVLKSLAFEIWMFINIFQFYLNSSHYTAVPKSQEYIRADILMFSWKMFSTFQFVDCKPQYSVSRDKQFLPGPRWSSPACWSPPWRHCLWPPSYHPHLLLPHQEAGTLMRIVSSQLWKETNCGYNWIIKYSTLTRNQLFSVHFF